jgi:hypothetical protein
MLTYVYVERLEDGKKSGPLCGKVRVDKPPGAMCPVILGPARHLAELLAGHSKS